MQFRSPTNASTTGVMLEFWINFWVSCSPPPGLTATLAHILTLVLWRWWRSRSQKFILATHLEGKWRTNPNPPYMLSKREKLVVYTVYSAEGQETYIRTALFLFLHSSFSYWSFAFDNLESIHHRETFSTIFVHTSLSRGTELYDLKRYQTRNSTRIRNSAASRCQRQRERLSVSWQPSRSPE